MLKVLFVHPDTKITSLYSKKLQNHFLVDSAQDGLIALRKSKINLPEVIVSEWNLPILSGAAFLKAIRTHPKLNHAPFLVFTGQDFDHQALGLGANEWLSQSTVSPQMLIERIWKHIQPIR